jgi:hypothetical protein
MTTTTDTATKYVVLNESTLGYINEERPNALGVLAGSVVRGGYNPLNGPVAIAPMIDELRPAEIEDFDTYRVEAPPGMLRSTPRSGRAY